MHILFLNKVLQALTILGGFFCSREVFIICMTNGTGEKKKKINTKRKKNTKPICKFYNQVEKCFMPTSECFMPTEGHLWSRVGPSELRVRWACELYTPLPCSAGPLVSPCATASRVSVRACAFILPDLAQVRAELPACASVLQNLAGGKTAIFFPPLR